MNKAKNLLAALESEISGTIIDEQGVPVVDEPKEESHENATPVIPELPAQDKYLLFLALMRDVLGHEGYDKFLEAHATELEVYNLIPSAEKTMISHKHLHSEREEMTPSEKEAAVALARAAGDPMYESLVSAERAVGDALHSIFEQYGGDVAKNAVKKTLDEVGQKMNAVDFDGADTIRNVIGTVSKRYATPAADGETEGAQESLVLAAIGTALGIAAGAGIGAAVKHAGNKIVNSPKYQEAVNMDPAKLATWIINTGKSNNVNFGVGADATAAIKAEFSNTKWKGAPKLSSRTCAGVPVGLVIDGETNKLVGMYCTVMQKDKPLACFDPAVSLYTTYAKANK